MSGAPQGWQTPKTNWASADVPAPSDFNRIEDNVSAIETGSRTLDPAQTPSSNSGTLRQILSWFANRIKAILGTTNWYDTPPTTLQAAKQHADSKTGHVPPGKYVAYTSRSDQAPAWSDIADKPSSFTPTAHKSTHASGGSDSLTPGDIGAAPASHGHVATEISTTPAGGISATNVQAALTELDAEKLGRGATDTDLEELTSFLFTVDTRKLVATAWDADNRPTAMEIRTPDDAAVIAAISITYNADGRPTQVQATAGGTTVTWTITWNGDQFQSWTKAVTQA